MASKIEERLEKLLALTQSPNEFEAMKAAKAAAKQDDIEAKIEELTYINTFIGENS